MSHRSSKRVRHSMKELGFDPKEVKMEEGSHAPVFMTFAPDAKGNMVPNPDGKHIIKIKAGKPSRLAPCGRKLYKDIKAGVAAGEIQ